MQHQSEQRIKQVPEQLDRLGGLLEELEKSLEALREDLLPVLPSREIQRGEGDETEKDAPPLAPLAHSLKVYCGRVEKAILQISSLQGSLQI